TGRPPAADDAPARGVRRYRTGPLREITHVLLLLLGLTLGGTLGFRLIEGADWLDCLYMAVITLTTVGFEHTVVPGPNGKIFIICYLMVGLGAFSYSAFQLGQWIVNSQLRLVLERRKMEKKTARMEGHHIVCGLGRMGTTICEYLQQRGRPFVVIDHDEEQLIRICSERSWVYLAGDATSDETLLAAGIERARSLATVLATDADNVYVVLSARLLNEKLQIVSRALDEKAIEKMERAGANRVISPFSSGAVRIARCMINPGIEDFLEVNVARNSQLELAELLMDESNPWVGSRLKELNLDSHGLVVVGVRRADGTCYVPPDGSTVILVDDTLFTFGSSDALNSVMAQSDQYPESGSG
ncbi:MAG: potassium channel protein, partial [Planctomycetaceae bacterium]|nr:potassium channel protein [Planctomycetaceae bacterium]